MYRHRLSQFCLRLGLGVTFIWIGISILRAPTDWIGFVPANLPFGLTREVALQINGGFDVALGAMLILGIFLKIAALLAAVHLLAILLTQGIDAVLIRDAGLLGAALALFFWPKNSHHWRW